MDSSGHPAAERPGGRVAAQQPCKDARETKTEQHSPGPGGLGFAPLQAILHALVLVGLPVPGTHEKITPYGGHRTTGPSRSSDRRRGEPVEPKVVPVQCA